MTKAEPDHVGNRNGSQTGSRRRAHALRIEAAWGYAFIAPMLIGLIAFFIYPIGRTIYLSFTDSGLLGDIHWIGIGNYTELVADPIFWTSMKNSFIYTGIQLIGIPIAMWIAALLNQKGLRGVGFYRVLYFLPVVTMPTAIALIWKLMYNSQYGPVNAFLARFGMEPISWLTNGRVALYAVAIVGIWSNIGINVVLFLAGLQAIPTDVYDAAEVDGASRRRVFWSITRPLLSPTVFFVTILTVIWGLQVFDLIFVMLGEKRQNPATAQAQTVVYQFYDRAFIENRVGSAAAMSLILLVVILIATGVQFFLQKRWVHYE